MNRLQVPARLFLAVCASLLFVSGCSTSSKDDAASTTPSTSATTPSTSATTPGTSEPSGDKAAFCREVNTANNIFESPGTTLNDTQTADMIKALESASNGAPNDVPADMNNVITAMLADLQAPTGKLPPNFTTNGQKLAQYAADYCG